MDNRKCHGCENPESVSYLEIGSINLVEGQKTIWIAVDDREVKDGGNLR